MDDCGLSWASMGSARRGDAGVIRCTPAIFWLALRQSAGTNAV